MSTNRKLTGLQLCELEQLLARLEAEMRTRRDEKSVAIISAVRDIANEEWDLPGIHSRTQTARAGARL